MVAQILVNMQLETAIMKNCQMLSGTILLLCVILRKYSTCYKLQQLFKVKCENTLSF